jgi:branched-chain amino acid aminotransferase
LTSESLIYIDGAFYPKSEAKISVYDHGLLYGDGVFEGIRAYKGVIFQLQEHLNRLYASAHAIKLNVPSTKAKLIRTVREVLRKNGLNDAYIRLIVTRGVGNLGVNPESCKKPSIIIITEKAESTTADGVAARGVSAIITSIRRDPPSATSHEIKSLNYLNSILAELEAIDAGVKVPIMLDQRGFVSEASAGNLFMVQDGMIATPPPTASILNGVTRKRLLRLIGELGYKFQERDITTFELFTADEVFLTGTKLEIVPVISISGRRIGRGKVGPVTTQLRKEFRKRVVSAREGTKV